MPKKNGMTEIKCAFLNASTRCQFRVLKLVWSEGSGYQIFRWTEREPDIYMEELETLDKAISAWNDAVCDNLGDGYMLLAQE